MTAIKVNIVNKKKSKSKKVKSLKRFVVVENVCGNYHEHFDKLKEAQDKIKSLVKQIYSSHIHGYEPYPTYKYSDFHIVDTYEQKIITIDVKEEVIVNKKAR